MALLIRIYAFWLYIVPLQFTFYELVRLTVRRLGVLQRCIFQQLPRLFSKYTPLAHCSEKHSVAMQGLPRQSKMNGLDAAHSLPT